MKAVHAAECWLSAKGILRVIDMSLRPENTCKDVHSAAQMITQHNQRVRIKMEDVIKLEESLLKTR